MQAYPLVHQQVIEEDRLKLEHHLEEQKAQKRRISRKVTAVKQTLKKSMVNAKRYVEYEPENDLAEDETSPQETAYDKETTMYCETIDRDRDRKEAVVLSEDANEIAKVARSTIETMEQILNGPKNTSFEDYFISRGESVLGKEKANGNL